MAIPGLMEKSERLGGLFSGLEEMGGAGVGKLSLHGCYLE